VLVVFDILCWGVRMFLYAIARNPWYFLVGRFINGFVYIVLQCVALALTLGLASRAEVAEQGLPSL